MRKVDIIPVMGCHVLMVVATILLRLHPLQMKYPKADGETERENAKPLSEMSHAEVSEWRDEMTQKYGHTDG